MLAVPIRVLIADTQPIVLEGLRSVLSPSGIHVIGEAFDGIEAITKTIDLDPDVLVLDFKLPRADALTVLQSVQSRAPRSKVILFASSEYRGEFPEAIRLGCSGILLKESSTDLIKKSIEKVHAGEIWLDTKTIAAVLHQFGSHRGALVCPLTKREREVIAGIARGLKNKQIAEQMSISEQTVKNHLQKLFDKLGVSDRLELALYAIHTGLHVELESFSEKKANTA
jgi:two-component system, NarL family, nitrate/nitrite response regulator NarL